MTIGNIKKQIFEIFDENGIYIEPDDTGEDIDLREYLVVSIQYVYFIVELEERLGVELPDEILIYDNLASLNGFVNMVAQFCEEEDDASTVEKDE